MTKKANPQKRIPSSFRDPSGFMFVSRQNIYRQINDSYKKQYEHLMKSGLYDELTSKGLLISHKESKKVKPFNSKTTYKIIKPSQLRLISYPYEWCFSQIKDAALTTLQIQKIALKYNMTLKDASGFNIQFIEGKTMFIDTLSFDFHKSDEPWIAYRQFCQHFLAPLVLASYVDLELTRLLRVYIDGIPLGLTSKLLPKKSYFNLYLLSHIHFHSKNQTFFEKKDTDSNHLKLSKHGALGLIENLTNVVSKLNLDNANTQWSDYYEQTNYSLKSFKEKENVTKSFFSHINPKTVWDMGANSGVFSRIASKLGATVVSTDKDHLSVERGYVLSKENREKNISHLVLDVANPSPGIGWENKERICLSKRIKVDCLMVLALVHHLTISENLPFNMTASFFRNISKWLIIEFVPPNDSNAKRLLRARKHTHTYSQNEFEKIYGKYFELIKRNKIEGSKRTLYLYKAK